MKKFLLSAALLIAVCISAKAQISVGVKGGVNFSKINTDNLNESTRTGYQAGVFARFGSALYFQPEVYLSSTGGKFSSDDGNFTAKVNFTNVSVPVLIGHEFGAKNLNFRLMAGPVYTYALDKSESFSDNTNAAVADFGHYKNSTLGFQAGGGVDIGPITADLRYEGGLTKINPDFGQRQNLWALSVGFKFF
ncbi:porin family protein [Mucilaginibacter ginsenosidivorans]|uniref:PorT family protein n=1 Tax=Mucilaginibacter ginsenosidivorans TaxID=398053 RepID=A0A5B8UR72_9SPHI|nr:porin family protein [Mucilaginibacter ginsenosidivorans]QEC61338.1 PorT family protein [Mucilaginibacter ginsenosidivorans]